MWSMKNECEVTLMLCCSRGGLSAGVFDWRRLWSGPAESPGVRPAQWRWHLHWRGGHRGLPGETGHVVSDQRQQRWSEQQVTEEEPNSSYSNREAHNDKLLFITEIIHFFSKHFLSIHSIFTALLACVWLVDFGWTNPECVFSGVLSAGPLLFLIQRDHMITGPCVSLDCNLHLCSLSVQTQRIILFTDQRNANFNILITWIWFFLYQKGKFNFLFIFCQSVTKLMN